MVVGIDGGVTARLVVADDVEVAVAQALAASRFYIDVTNDVLVSNAKIQKKLRRRTSLYIYELSLFHRYIIALICAYLMAFSIR